MRTASHVFIAILLFSFGIRSSAAQTSEAKKKKPPKVVSLSGCLVRDETDPQQFVIDDASEGKYRLSGKDFTEYVGRTVTVNGGVVVKGIAIQGGLTPNANIAAQAGALDPGRAAVQAATQPGGPRGAAAELPEFRVKKISTAVGTCEKP